MGNLHHFRITLSEGELSLCRKLFALGTSICKKQQIGRCHNGQNIFKIHRVTIYRNVNQSETL